MRQFSSFTAAFAFVFTMAAQSSATRPKRFVITEFAAVSDGTTVNTKAIQSAIDKCAASGGGVLVLLKVRLLAGPFS